MALTRDDKQFIVGTFKSLLSDDRKRLKIYFDDLFDMKLDQKLGEKYKERFGNLPTKDELYEQNLKILKRLDDIESQMTMLSGRTYDNTDQITKLQTIHPHNTHPAFA